MKFSLFNKLFFVLCIVSLISYNPISFAGEFKIKQIKINDEIPNWGELRISKAALYTKLSQEGIPSNLVWKVYLNSISFSLDIKDTCMSHYRYKLIGKDKTWNKVNKSSEARYINLKPAPYTFIIQEFDEMHVLQEKRFQFKRIPFFIDSWESDIGFFLINLSLLAIFYSFVGKRNQTV